MSSSRGSYAGEQQTLVNRYFISTDLYWEEIYKRETVYAAIYRQRLQAALRLVDRLTFEPRSAALEVGCGPGFGTVALAQRGFSVHAIDTVPKMVRRMLEREIDEGAGSKVKGCVSDVHALPFVDSTFDLVLVIGVTEWLASLEKPFDEIARVLKPGGHVVVSADNAWALHCVLDPMQNPLVVPMKRALGALIRRLRHSKPNLRTRSYSIRKFDSALRRAGLRKVDGVTVGFGPFSFFNRKLIPDTIGLSLHHRLQKLADRRAFALRSCGLTYVVAARKT